MSRNVDPRLIGRHLLLELGGCEPARLDDPESVRGFLRDGARAAGATLVTETVHRFEPIGVTGLGLLAESHLSIHTWPERRYAAIDLMTCGEACDLDAVVACARAAFGAARVEIRVLERRLP